jgi:hypothetical protein
VSLRAIATSTLIGLQGCGRPAAIERPPPASAAAHGQGVDADPRAAHSPGDTGGCSCDRIAAPVEVPTGVARRRWDEAHLGVARLLRELDRVIQDRGCDATVEITAVLDGHTSIEREWGELAAESCGHFARWLEAGADILPLEQPVVDAVRAGCFGEQAGGRLASLVFPATCVSGQTTVTIEY